MNPPPETPDIPRRPCPKCGTMIAVAARKCFFCKAEFGGPEPPREVRAVITDVQIPFDRAIYLVGFWWAASLVFGMLLGVVVGVGLVLLGGLVRGG